MSSDESFEIEDQNCSEVSEESSDSSENSFEFEDEEAELSREKPLPFSEAATNSSNHDTSCGARAYSDEPLADAEWLQEYRERKETAEEQRQILEKRLHGITKVKEWCTCGNCSLKKLQNISECYCCQELERCVESLESDMVRSDVDCDVNLRCITQHPGFDPVCLQKWSLRLASGKYSTKSGKRYQQTDSEDRFLRSVAYREFTRLVYGPLGRKRIPLPACAYTQIRTVFPGSPEETHAGFEMPEI